MKRFWSFARRMLRYRFTAAGAVIMAIVSAGGLGLGLVGLVPVLKNILNEDGQTLPELARSLNASLAGKGLAIPDAWIASLPTDRFDAVLYIVIGLGVLTVIGGTANFLHEYLSLTLVTRTVASIRREVFHRVLHLPLGLLVRGSGSDMASRIITDTAYLGRGFQVLTSKALAQLTKGAAALGAAFLIDWRLSLATLGIAPLMFMIIRKLGKRIRRASRGAMQSQASLLGVIHETLAAFRVVKVSGSERKELGRFTRHNRAVIREEFRLRTARALAGPLIEIVTIFVLGTLAIVAAKLIIDGKMEASHFMGALGSLALAGASLKPLAGVIHEIQAAGPAAVRLGELLAIPMEEPMRAKKPALARHARAIEFKGVSFAYPGTERPALDRIDLTIAHGETVAFVGPNGSGKTTLLSLVPRLFDPDEGALLIDGVDIASVSLRSLRRQIGVVTQETVLFRGTIAENIAYARTEPGEIPTDRIIEAAKRAHAHEFIQQQPAGYRTRVGDQGLTLSGGQRQRIAIARAILRDPAILIMDEATSMIDAESERRIAEAIAEFSRSRTCLIVAHRLSTVINADRIVVMVAGRIADSGTHAELLDRCPTYRALVHHQLQPVTTT